VPGVTITSTVDGLTAIFGLPPRFSFHWQAEIHAECPAPYHVAMYEYTHSEVRRLLHRECCGAAVVIWARSRPWYCGL